jgi:GTP cyclohydrolase IA
MNSHSSISELVTHERPALSEVGRVLPIQPDHEHRRSDPTRIDRPALERAVSDMLAALGVDATAEGLRETPRRVAGAFIDLLAPEPFQPTTFPNDEHYDELVLARAIPVQSVCEHHMLPFLGTAHVGYLPGSGSSGCPSSRGSSSCSPAAPRSRNG